MGNWKYNITGEILKTEDEKLNFVNKVFEEKNIKLERYRKGYIKLYNKYYKEIHKNNLIIQAPIDKDIKRRVIELRQQGLSYRKIAGKTGISKSSVGNIIKAEQQQRKNPSL